MAEILLGKVPLIDPDLLKRRNVKAGFFFHFANRALDEAFVPLDVATWEIQARPVLF